MEFVVVQNQNTFPKYQELPEVYKELAYNGKREMYLTSPRKIKVKVEVLKKRNKPIILHGEKLKKFAITNFNINVKTLHFVEEGEDEFYVTDYYENGREAIGYSDIDILNRFPRFMTRVLPYGEVVRQTLCEDFVYKRPENKFVKIKVNFVNYHTRLHRRQVGTAEAYEYQIDNHIWNKIQDDLSLEPGMRVVLMKKNPRTYWLTDFAEDGDASSFVHFHGRIKLKKVQPDLSPLEKDDRLKHKFQWLKHRDHFGESVDVFYKELSLIQDKERLAIPARFQDKHPMHMYTKVLMKHDNHEKIMSMEMDFHSEKPDKSNHVNVKGKWKNFAKRCKFDYNKMIRFHLMRIEVDENAEDDEPEEYPVFHLC